MVPGVAVQDELEEFEFPAKIQILKMVSKKSIETIIQPNDRRY